MKKLYFAFLIALLAFIGPIAFADETTSTTVITSSTDYISVSETYTLFTSIADSDITGSTFTLDAPVCAIEVINNTTQTAAANTQGKALDSGLTRVEIYGGVSENLPSDTMKLLRRDNSMITQYGIYELDTRNIGVLKAKLVVSSTPGIDVKVLFRYKEYGGFTYDPIR